MGVRIVTYVCIELLHMFVFRNVTNVGIVEMLLMCMEMLHVCIEM